MEDSEQKTATRLAAHCNLRRKETTEITPNDIVESEAGITFFRVREEVAKHDHYREVPVSPTLANKLEPYIEFNVNGDDAPLVDVHDKTVCRWVMRATARLEEQIDDDGWGYVNVYDLRRSWGTHLLEQGVLPSVLMSWGGWRDWTTFRDHYLGEFSPKVVERERQEVNFLAEGEPIDAEPMVHGIPSGGGYAHGDD